ncbi:hypothetical protein AB5I39_10865 [Sphingomonas sp. MMS24-J45]|uniref:hypothetical protein n=1 Tax=Sphingomonas sp. MMS24-J45 TaxID=3238806 RepID=UPI00384CB368
MKRNLALALAATAALGACATTPRVAPVEVSRFHLGAPLETGTLTTEPMPGTGAPGLEFRSYAAAVETEALKNGFTIPASGTTAQYVAVVGFSRTARQGPPKSGGLTIGLGGGGFSGGNGGGVGLGGGVSFPVGKQRYREIVVTQETVQIRRRRDGTVIWEGRAETSADSAAPDAQTDPTAAKLARALFQGFPGESGRTITVK